MNPDFQYLLNELFVYVDPEKGPSVKCLDFEHLDYIDDVLSEKFEIEVASMTQDDQARKFILHFEENVSKEDLSKAIEAINSYHQVRQSTYKTQFDNQ